MALNNLISSHIAGATWVLAIGALGLWYERVLRGWRDLRRAARQEPTAENTARAERPTVIATAQGIGVIAAILLLFLVLDAVF